MCSGAVAQYAQSKSEIKGQYCLADQYDQKLAD